MVQDSMGEVVPAEHSTKSLAKSLSLRLFHEADALKCLGRLAVVYGDAKIADAKQRRLLSFEWSEAFAFIAPARVHAAIGRLLLTLKFWPTIAEVMAEVKADAPPPERLPVHRAEPLEEFARDGRTEGEEIAYRAAQILNMKRQYGFGSAPDPLEEMQAKRVVIPAAPDDGHVSPELRALVEKRRQFGAAA